MKNQTAEQILDEVFKERKINKAWIIESKEATIEAILRFNQSQSKQTMEIIDFRIKTFGEIPKQDNPAYDIHECVLLCKAEADQTGCFVVAKIDENHKDKDEVSQLGLFWNIEMALLFAKNIPSGIKIKPIDGGKTWSTLLRHEFPLP